MSYVINEIYYEKFSDALKNKSFKLVLAHYTDSF